MSILPANLSLLEQRLESAGGERLALIDSPIDRLWNASTCPKAALPYLAWALSVDYWRSDWSESVQREVVRRAIDQHSIKGTRPAVERAIASLGLDARCIEWFEMTPPGAPATFNVEIFTVDKAITADMARQVGHTINSAKRAALHLTDVQIKMRSEARLFMGGISQIGERLTLFPQQRTEFIQRSQPVVGIALSLTETVRLSP